MTRLFKIIFIIILFSIINVNASKKTINLATLNWPPYVKEKPENDGFIIEIVTEAFNKVGYKVKITFMPWKRVLKSVKEGKFDALFPSYYSEYRAKTYALSLPIGNGPIVIYKRVGEKISFSNLSDLKPYPIAVVRGYINTKEFDEADFLNKVESDNDISSLKMLYKGLVDLAVIDKYTAEYILTESLLEAKGKLESLANPLEEKPLYLGFSKKIPNYQKFLNDFNKGLNQISENGMIKKIMKKYGFKN